MLDGAGRGTREETAASSQWQLLPITFDIEPIGFQDSALKSELPGCYEETFLKVRK